MGICDLSDCTEAAQGRSEYGEFCSPAHEGAARRARELDLLISRMREVSSRVYWMFFGAGMGSEAHAFIEFNGLISKYVDICERAAEKGVDFRDANVHTRVSLPVEGHDMDYMAEKLRCIFGPAIDSNPELRDRFKRKLFGE